MTLSGNTIRTAPPERLRVDAVLLDLDGTLLDSNDAHAQAWLDTFAEAGWGFAFDEVRRLVGMGGEELIETLTGIGRDDPRGKELRERHGRRFREHHLPTIVPQPGAHELVEKLHRRGFPLVVASSSSEENLRALVDLVGIGALVTTVTSADDVDRAKPEPDVLRAALAKVGVRPDHGVLIGDTPYDVEAGRRAGVAVIALRCGGWEDEALDGAIEVFDDPADLLRNWMQTPFRASITDLDAPL